MSNSIAARGSFEDPGWFFDLVGERPAPRHLPLRAPALERPSGTVLPLLAVPVLMVVQVAVFGPLAIGVPGWLLLGEFLIGLVLSARTPFPWYAGWLALATGLIVASAVAEAIAPVPLQTAAVEEVLYQRVFDLETPLDPGTAVVSCPRFDRARVHQAIECTGRDAQRSLVLAVTPVDRNGNLSLRVLPD